jgi:hypothetical protein
MIININIKDIEDSLPLEYKQKGLGKLGNILQERILVGQQQIISSIQKEFKKFENGCPLNINDIILKRNNIQNKILDYLKLINIITKNIEKTNNIYNITLNLIKILTTTKDTSSVALKLIPLAPGVAVSGLSDLNTLINNIIFDKNGGSKINKLKYNIDSISFNISLIEKILYGILLIFQQLDILIQKCTKLEPIPSDLLLFINSQNQINEQISDTLYKGFNIQIEEIPFNKKINRNKAVGYNSQGIKLIETKLSFTKNPIILINELKFQIDTNNLKAY